MKILVATNNKHKLKEIKEILGQNTELVSMAEFGIDCEIEENGNTFLDNAMLKAKGIMKISGIPTLADDSGLMVDALHGAPGVYSARYAGTAHDDVKNRIKLLNELEGVPYEKRTASFTTVAVLAFPDGRTMFAKGEVFGHIIFEERGSNGFGYDPLFYSDELGKTFAEATEDEKNSVSHRSRALKRLYQELNK